jgi:hypothetical protein
MYKEPSTRLSRHNFICSQMMKSRPAFRSAKLSSRPTQRIDLLTGRVPTQCTTERPSSCLKMAKWKLIFILNLFGHPILCGLKILCALVLTIIKRVQQNVFLVFPKGSPSSSTVPNSTSILSHSCLASMEVRLFVYICFVHWDLPNHSPSCCSLGTIGKPSMSRVHQVGFIIFDLE